MIKSSPTTRLTTIDEATDAYASFCERSGLIFEQPNCGLSRLVKAARPYWLLANRHGSLARVDARSLKVHGDNPCPLGGCALALMAMRQVANSRSRIRDMQTDGLQQLMWWYACTEPEPTTWT